MPPPSLVARLTDLAGASGELGQLVAADQPEPRAEIGQREQDRQPKQEQAEDARHRLSLMTSATSLAPTSNAASLNKGGPMSIGGSLLNP